MSQRLAKIRANRRQRQRRSRLSLNLSQPRLAVNISLNHVRAQVIDDTSGQTLVAASSLKPKLQGNLTQKATQVGEQIAKLCLEKKITKVVFDRGQRAYHGRLAALAKAAREKGLEF